jgi:hypothetical protein
MEIPLIAGREEKIHVHFHENVIYHYILEKVWLDPSKLKMHAMSPVISILEIWPIEMKAIVNKIYLLGHFANIQSEEKW